MRRTIKFMPTEQANIVPGEIVDGKVQGITNFGAFIELSGGVVGLVHISEIADTYVKNVRDFIQVGDQVKVKVLNVSGNKVGLSMKQAVSSPKPEFKEEKYKKPISNSGKKISNQNEQRFKSEPISLDDKIAKFLKESDERMQPIKNRLEQKKRRNTP